MSHILLVEDDPFISDIVETKLVAGGYEIESTADASSVIPKIKERKPALVLLDLMLPNKHGFEVLKEIRDDEAISDTKVIILSNESGSDVENKAAAMNAKYFFKAMTDMNELVDIVKAELS